MEAAGKGLQTNWNGWESELKGSCTLVTTCTVALNLPEVVEKYRIRWKYNSIQNWNTSDGSSGARFRLCTLWLRLRPGFSLRSWVSLGVRLVELVEAFIGSRWWWLDEVESRNRMIDRWWLQTYREWEEWREGEREGRNTEDYMARNISYDDKNLNVLTILSTNTN